MLMRDFYDILDQSKGWKLDDDNALRRRTRKRCYCPITYVAYRVTGKFFPEIFYTKAVKAIGLRQKIADRIVSAADNNLYNVNAKRNRGIITVRNRLLRAVGLE